MRGNCSGFELGSVFPGVAAADLCHRFYGSRPGLVVDDFAVGVDARHDEQAAIGFEIFPVT
jgi:hypothetical protein